MTERYRSANFVVYSNITSYDISWFFPFIENVHSRLVNAFGFEKQPKPTNVYLEQGAPGTIGGWASGGNFGVSAGDFVQNHWTMGVAIQEYVNCFTGYITACWPTEWWANHKSPFPIMVSVEIMRELGYNNEANQRESLFINDPLYAMFKRLKTDFGWGIFKNAFAYMLRDRINLCNYSEPDKTYRVCAYLNCGAGKELFDYYRSGGLSVDENAVRNYQRQICGLGNGWEHTMRVWKTQADSGLNDNIISAVESVPPNSNYSSRGGYILTGDYVQHDYNGGVGQNYGKAVWQAIIQRGFSNLISKITIDNVEVPKPAVYKCRLEVINLNTNQSIVQDWHNMEPPGLPARLSSQVLQYRSGDMLKIRAWVYQDGIAVTGKTLVFTSGDGQGQWGSPVPAWTEKVLNNGYAEHTIMWTNLPVGRRFTLYVFLRE